MKIRHTFIILTVVYVRSRGKMRTTHKPDEQHFKWDKNGKKNRKRRENSKMK